MGVTIGDEEADNNADEEGELAGNVKEEEVLGESSEEAKLQGREEGGVDRP